MPNALQELMEMLARLQIPDDDDLEEVAFTRDEAVAVATALLPDCWEITPEGEHDIRLRHGHREPCIGKDTYDDTMGVVRFMENLNGLFPGKEIVAVLERLRGTPADPPMPF